MIQPFYNWTTLNFHPPRFSSDRQWNIKMWFPAVFFVGTHTGSDCLSGDGDMEYREYRDVFYANRCPDQQSQRGDFLLKTEELFPARCLFCFQMWSRGRSSLPFQSKIGCRRHLVVSRQERGHKMMLNCFSKEFNKIGLGMMADNGGIQTSRFALDAKNAEFSGSCCKDLQRLRILYEGVTGGRVLSNLQSFYLSPDKMDLKQISWPDFPLVQPYLPQLSPPRSGFCRSPCDTLDTGSNPIYFLFLNCL